jgi:mono/diheme cytochrome c family protein
VAHWAELDVVNFLKNGISRQGSASGPMAEVVLHGTQHLSAADATAMARYLQGTQGAATPAASVPPPPPPAAPASVKAMGMAVYEKHCAQCHGKQGQGEPGAYPALAKNRAVNLSNSNNLVLTVLRGGFAPSTAGNPRPFGMPPFSLALTDAEVAAVLTYVRGAWGNAAGPVAEFDINKLRSSIRQ